MSSIGSRSCLRLVGAFAVVGAGLVGVPAVAQPSTGPARTAWSEAQAVRLAAASSERVEVQEKTSEYSRTFASPDGTLTAEISNTPVRVKRGSQWIPVDATLEVRPDGWVGAKAAYADMRFSGGGSGPLATVTTEAGSLSLGSPWGLGPPVLSGSTATYAEVLPGVDLVIDATVEAFSYNLVVRTRAAAANPALRSVRFPVSTNGLEIRNKIPGRPSYVDANGRAILTVGEALMWDSAGGQAQPAGKTTSGSSSDLVEDGPPAGSRTAEMELSGDATGLTIEPDVAMLTGADTVFPVVLDPTMGGARIRNAWTAAWELYPNTSFYKTNHSLGVGYEGFEQHKIVRSFWQFEVSGFAGKKIVSASFRTYSVHSANCTPKSVTVSRTSPITTATTWNNQPKWQADVASGTFAKGYSSSCPDGYVDFNVTDSMQYTATYLGKTTTFRLRATSETDAIAWKQFNSSGLLTVDYIAYPIQPYDLGAASTSTDPVDACAGSSAPTVLSERRPTFFARGRVGAGDTSANVKVQFQVVSQYGTVWTMTDGVHPAGWLARQTMASDLPEVTLFHYHARTLYPYPGGELVGPWSGNCYFRIDMTPPPAPTVTASYKGQALANCYLTSPDPCLEIARFGESVTYTISSSATDVVALRYWLVGQPYRNASGRSVTVALHPPKEGELILGAVAQDAAQRWSKTTHFKINVGAGAPPVASWAFDETSGTTANDSSGNGQHLTVSGATFDNDGRMSGSVVFNGTSNYATRSPAPIDTSKSFTIAAWVRLTAFEEGGVVGVPGALGLGAQLYYSQGTHRWVFMQNVSDSATAGQARVESVDPPLWGAWTHLLGVYDANAKAVALYVNGRLQDTATFTHTPWRATGPLDIGCYRFNGTYGSTFAGSIDHVQVWTRPILADEAREQANPRSGAAGSDETVAGLAARWSLDGTYAATGDIWVTAESTYGANMRVAGFGSTADQSTAFVKDEERGRVLAMTGKASEAVSLPRPVVDAHGSFTVAVWVKMVDTSRSQVIVRQAGTSKDSWRIQYVPTGGDGANWVFSRATSDSAAGSDIVSVAPTSVLTAADEWTLLVGIYDAQLDRVRLMVRDYSFNEGEVFSSPVRTGSTVVGTGSVTGSKLTGLLDDLRIYSGVVSQRRVCTELLGGTECS